MAQTDFKKLVAYSSVSHMGYVILGIAVWSSAERSQYWSWGMNGAMFQMIATASPRPACSSSSASSTTAPTTAT